MKLTKYAAYIGQTVHVPLTDAPVTTLASLEDKIETLTQAAARYGLHPKSIDQFYRRHPECACWSVDRVCEQIVSNKNQADVARRQGVTPGKGRVKFGKISYE